jgi:hypothetical protein
VPGAAAQQRGSPFLASVRPRLAQHRWAVPGSMGRDHRNGLMVAAGSFANPPDASFLLGAGRAVGTEAGARPVSPDVAYCRRSSTSPTWPYRAVAERAGQSASDTDDGRCE